MPLEKGNKLPSRAEVPAALKWQIEKIYANDDLWEKEFAGVKEIGAQIAGFQGRLAESAQTFYQITVLQDSLREKIYRVYAYASMRKDEDNTNAHYQILTDRAQALFVEVSSAASYLTPELLGIPEETLARFFAEEPRLELYRHFIMELVRRKAHTLSVSEERLIAMSGEVTSAPDDIYSMITNADLKFPSIKDADGNEVELSEGRYIQFMENRDRRVRRDAFETLYGTYNKQRNTLATCLMSSVKKDIFLSRARHYPTSRAFYLDDNNIPEAVYDQLIEVVHEHNPLVHRYMRLRKEALGFGDLHMYDIYTPIVKGVDIKVPFEEAKKTVAAGMTPLGPDYVKALADGMDGGWIDVPENLGKTTGAYCASVYPGPPFVLLNYNDSLDDMFTLAHEMGHAMHGWYSFKHQPHIYSGHRIFLAEVASTLNECLLLDHLIKKATDKTTRLYLLNHYLEQFRGTVFRQTMFAEFEQIIHAKVEGGEALGADALSAIYHDLNVAYYGPEMTVDAPIDLEWGRIPHFYMPFYVYQYATGFSAAVALSQQILKEGAPAVKRYINFLSSGESKYPIDTLKDAGVDMTSPEPVRMALEVFRTTLEEMENLLER